jgi:mRNA interferase MazF
LKRGDLLTVAMRGDYGKPRPAVVAQTDELSGIDSVLICYLTSELHDLPSFRIDISADEHTKLEFSSQIMADKIFAIPREKCGPVFGRAPQSVMDELSVAIGFVFGLGVSEA